MVCALVVFYPFALTPLPLLLIFPVLVPLLLILVVIYDRHVWSYSVCTVNVRRRRRNWYHASYLDNIVLTGWFLWLNMYRSLEF